MYSLKVIGVAVYYKTLSCEHSHTLAAVAYISVAMTTWVMLLEALTVYFSSRGTIKNSRPRRFVPYLLYGRIAFFVLELVSLIVKTVLVAETGKVSSTQGCPTNTVIVIASIIVVVTWLTFFSLFLAVLTYLDPCHLYSAKVDFSSVDHRVDGEIDLAYQRWRLSHTVWEKRFRILCCVAGSDESHQTAYREMSEIFAYLFYDSNLVLSDIAAGLILLQKEHLAHEASLASMLEDQIHRPCRSVSVNFRDPVERRLFSDSLHYLKFALGVYSWAIHIYMNPLKGCCSLCSRVSCRGRARLRNYIHEDNSCFCGLAGFMSNTKINHADVLYARFENDVYKAPFVVCLDHETESVVVTIRGTLSLQDLITDLTASGHPMQLPDWPKFMVHKGMYQTALWIKEYLDDGILEEAFDKVPRYKLVVTGHSLGSGCACILAILLQEKYPDLRCFCFSPTGSLLNADAAAYTQSFITSITLGQDLVCRLSIRTAHRLKQDVIRVLENCRKPKYRIILEGVLETLGKCCGRDVLFTGSTSRDYSETQDESEQEDEVSSPLLLLESSEGALESLENFGEPDNIPQLYPPGRIIHIVDTLEERRCFFAQRRLEARWSSANCFEDIVVSPDMLRDHLPDVIFNAMKNIMEEKEAELSEVVINHSATI